MRAVRTMFAAGPGSGVPAVMSLTGTGIGVAPFRTALYNAHAGTRTRFPSPPRMSQRFAVHANDPRGRLPGRAPAVPGICDPARWAGRPRTVRSLARAGRA